MKTLQDIQADIDVTILNIREAEKRGDRKSKTLAKKLRSELIKLNQYKLYLETNPTEDFIRESAKKIQYTIHTIIDNRNAQYGITISTHPDFINGNPKLRKTYLKEQGVPKLRQQLAQLKYLLS